MSTLLSSDGAKFRVSPLFIEKSTTLTDLITDLEKQEDRCEQLDCEKQLDRCEQLDCEKEEKIPIPLFTLQQLELIDQVFKSREFPTFFPDLILVLQGFDYFSMEEELEEGIKTLASLLEGKTSKEIRDILRLPDDLNQEEKSEVKKKLYFLEEKEDLLQEDSLDKKEEILQEEVVFEEKDL